MPLWAFGLGLCCSLLVALLVCAGLAVTSVVSCVGVTPSDVHGGGQDHHHGGGGGGAGCQLRSEQHEDKVSHLASPGIKH